MKKLTLAISLVTVFGLTSFATSAAEAAGFGWSSSSPVYVNTYPVYQTYKTYPTYKTYTSSKVYLGNAGVYVDGDHAYHNTSHLHYRPAHLKRHGDHFHYVPERYEVHHTGHWHHLHD